MYSLLCLTVSSRLYKQCPFYSFTISSRSFGQIVFSTRTRSFHIKRVIFMSSIMVCYLFTFLLSSFSVSSFLFYLLFSIFSLFFFTSRGSYRLRKAIFPSVNIANYSTQVRGHGYS